MPKELFKLWEFPLTDFGEFTREELFSNIDSWMHTLEKLLDVENNLLFTKLEDGLVLLPEGGVRLVIYLKLRDLTTPRWGIQKSLVFEDQTLPSVVIAPQEMIEQDFARLSSCRRRVVKMFESAPSVLAGLNTGAFFMDTDAIHPDLQEVRALAGITLALKQRSKKPLKMMANVLGQVEFPDFKKFEWDTNCHFVRAKISRTANGYQASFIHSLIPVENSHKFDLDRPSDPKIDDALNKAERERTAINLSIKVGRQFGEDSWTRGHVQEILPDQTT